MRNKILLSLLFIFTFLFAVFFILNSFGIDIMAKINFRKYAEITEEGITVSFYGSKNIARKVKVDNGDKTSLIKGLEISPSALSDTGVSAIAFEDVDLDGNADILLIANTDPDGDTHRYVLLKKSDEGFSLAYKEPISNITVDSVLGGVISEDTDIEIIAPEATNSPYKEIVTKREFVILGDTLTLSSEISVAYFSETEIYRFSTTTYDTSTGEITTTNDEWILPEQYPSVRDKLQLLFSLSIPK